MIGKDQNPNIGKLTQFKHGRSGNPKGRPKGSKSLSTIVRELESEEFDWDKLIRINKGLQQLVDNYRQFGSPLRALVYKAFFDSICGNAREKASAREWLRKACYGNKIETQIAERQRAEPIIISDIKTRA